MGLSIPGSKVFNQKDTVDLLGYNINPVPISEVIWLNKNILLSFDLMIYEKALKHSAVVDIDFFTHYKDEVFEKEKARSFASVTANDKEILLSWNDFGIKSPYAVKLFDCDNNWHSFEIEIFRENLWCPNKKCKFEDCAHIDAESLGDDYLGWDHKGLKKHRRVSVSIDGLEKKYFNYMTEANNSVISFGNNNFNLTKDPNLHADIVKYNLTNKPSLSLRNIKASYGEDELAFTLKNNIN
jgi:hypothetical protein